MYPGTQHHQMFLEHVNRNRAERGLALRPVNHTFDFSYKHSARQAGLDAVEFSQLLRDFRDFASPKEIVSILLAGRQHLESREETDKCQIVRDIQAFMESKFKQVNERKAKHKPSQAQAQHPPKSPPKSPPKENPLLGMTNANDDLKAMIRQVYLPFAQFVFNRKFKSPEDMCDSMQASTLSCPC